MLTMCPFARLPPVPVFLPLQLSVCKGDQHSRLEEVDCRLCSVVSLLTLREAQLLRANVFP
ncbi:rCG42174 [Rattus norvegicus]|uniref:RCG42174 n=1 Tax=Rattus norvegicus TaxID=10116 RepID=A6K043_RAT|nr:rCG42174 [Rattus norvegicus]